jgi:Family of unknown function (DUF6159)
MFARIAYTWRLMGASYEVLRRDKELVFFPLMSSVCCLLILASFAAPILLTRAWEGAHLGPLYYVVMFFFYFSNYFIITFFNAAIVGSAVVRLSGGEPTFGDGLRTATSRLPQILAWAALAATVGLVLRVIEERSEKIGRLVAGLMGAAWSLATFLVVPVLVVEQKGPIEALKKSTSLLRKTWGDQLVSGAAFGFIFFILALPGFGLLFVGFLGGFKVGLAGLVVGLLYLLLLALVHSALQAVFEAAVYLYAEKGAAPELFGRELLSGALVSR